MRTESYYDSRYMSVENESDGRACSCVLHRARAYHDVRQPK